MPALCRVRGTAEDIDRQDTEVQAAGDGEGGVRSVKTAARIVGKRDRKRAVVGPLGPCPECRSQVRLSDCACCRGRAPGRARRLPGTACSLQKNAQADT